MHRSKLRNALPGQSLWQYLIFIFCGPKLRAPPRVINRRDARVAKEHPARLRKCNALQHGAPLSAHLDALYILIP
jgi:hypothetical protein